MSELSEPIVEREDVEIIIIGAPIFMRFVVRTSVLTTNLSKLSKAW
ncbi:MAG: hypothetical protein GDA43_08675 [Hormoscilla sp. SP5CHS1]|nr:hypothetical protein [Hormoscilla sp. SP12CHS1]MBC6453276.1 hypothetical protein [Hormoscilla sp. SP5CHS1]